MSGQLGSAGHCKDLTETRNRARKVSGTLACSRRSDSGERCEVKGARKIKAREGER